MAKTRTFVAIDTDDAMRRRASGLIDRLRPYAPQARWVQEENLHLTLLFMGDLSDSEIAETCSRVDWVCRANQPFTLRLAGVGAFPDASRPKAVWLGATEGAEPLSRLHSDLDDALGDLAARGENRAFVPHLTLARVGGRGQGSKGKGGGGVSEHLPEVLMGLADYDAGTLSVDAVTVFASELRREGPEYQPLARCRLGMGEE